MKKIFLLAAFTACAFGQLTAQSKNANAELTGVTGEKESVTQHSINVGGQNIAYTATAGYLLLPNDTGKSIARIFYTYYKRNNTTPENQPITFCFNGGPGSSSVWLHMGGLAPRMVQLKEDGTAPTPPYKVVDNPYTWLDKTDMVFIDPVSTGYSRAESGTKASQFHGFNGDIESVGAFINHFLNRSKRWASAKYLAGESYGTTRAAGLSKFLTERYRIYLNGVILISAILNFGTNDYYVGNDLPRALYIPSYTAAAWYHKKLSPELQAKPLKEVLAQSEAFALSDYILALHKGFLLSNNEKERIAQRMSELTGLNKTFILQHELRVTEDHFWKELRRTDGLIVGRLDARFTGRDIDEGGEAVSFDPSFTNIDGPFTAAMNDYFGRELNFNSNEIYNIFGNVRPWDYTNVQNQFLNVAEMLRDAMARNPSLKVYLGGGYYDFATPYFTAQYDFNHMLLRPEQMQRVRMHWYESGHMYYINKPSLVQFKKDMDSFFDWSDGR